MRRLPILVVLASLAAVASAPSYAYICYMVLDKGGSAIYRDQQPPVDMSSAGASARDQMRARGELLIIMDTDKCQLITPVRAGSAPLTADQVLADAPPMQMSVGNTSSPASGFTGSRPGIPAPMPASSSGPAAVPAAALPAAVRNGNALRAN